MNNGKIIEIITGVPFIIGLIFVVTLAVFWVFIVPYQDYTLNSNVLTKNSYLKFDTNDKLEFYINANLFPEITKESSFQREISEEQLKKALLRKELKLLEEYKTNPKNAQNLFDLGVWYLYTSGVRSSLKQIAKDRGNRLLASYYYFKKFNLIDPKEKFIPTLIEKINKYIDKESKNNVEFYNNLTLKLEKDFDKPQTKKEEEQKDLLKKVLEYNKETTKNKKVQNTEALCKFYENNIKTYSRSRKLGFKNASYYCYKDLSRYSKQFHSQVNKYKKMVSTFDYSKE